MSYKQPTKHLVRVEALTHAVEILTTRRNRCTIAADEYVPNVVSKLSGRDRGDYDNWAARQFREEDIRSWQVFRESTIGKRNASDLTVAYLAGPEPTNDLTTLIDLGVRPENIWAFESDAGAFDAAHLDVRRAALRGVKLMNVSIEDYFVGSPRRFDIIYFDACAPLPSHDQKTTRTLVNLFRHSALSPLGVLITNFSEPDLSKPLTVNNYAHLVAAYLYPKAFLDTHGNPDHTYTDGAIAQGFVLLPNKGEDEATDQGSHTRADEDDNNLDRDFLGEVISNFAEYYGSFITRHIADIASIIAPTVRVLGSPLAKELVSDPKQAIAHARSFLEFSLDPPSLEVDAIDEVTGHDSGGDAVTEPELFSLLYTLASCGLMGNKNDFDLPSADARKFCQRWASQLTGQPEPSIRAIDAILCFYSLRHDEQYWAEAMKRVREFNYEKMPFLCDVPTSELGFYPAFAQLAYPAHANVRETRRYRYVAEGKTTSMLLDVTPFDECRYVYDWLSTAPLIDSDWSDISRQLIFRAALDAIAKNKRWYQDDFLYGCHIVGMDSDDFDPPMYGLRQTVTASGDKRPTQQAAKVATVPPERQP